ncbi:MAG: hypothetical protein HN704_03925 [Bacteroidetes bacterium]|jgi:uncharacterized protein YjiK|nr:hypothetical protein [Bacteroidota bacterium]MBT6684797.1 hypothetical protein [Bacteroidota bacterium]MBT7141773.1 hypothetical protein [Bacteroidota bacterium]MBT7490741.1 hypothetical protein [Bacteroidota bacterium]
MKLSILYIFIFLAFLSCNKNDELQTLSPINSISIEVPEPSGMCFNNFLDCFYIVGDSTKSVYRLNLLGQLIAEYQDVGNDLEGISFNPDNSSFLIAEEKNRAIIEIDILGNVLSTNNVSGMNLDNKGLEGITYNTNNQHIYLLNEEDPGQLIELDTNFVTLNTYDLDFAADYSGICYNNIEDNFWVVSEESKLIVKCDLFGNSIQKYKINEEKTEGIVFVNNTIYLVSDSESKIYIYSLE